MKKMLLC